MHQEKAFDDGFATTKPTHIHPQMQKAVDAIRTYFDDMLDRGDEAGLLPGKRTLERVSKEFDEIQDQLDELVGERDIIRAVFDLNRIEDIAEPFSDKVMTREEWGRQFGPDRTVKSPVGDIRVGENQFDKLQANKRGSFAQLVHPTLTNPLLVIKDTRDGMLFIKPFKNEKTITFVSVAYDINGQVTSVSNHNQAIKLCKKSPRRRRIAL